MSHTPEHLVDKATALIEKEGGFVNFVRDAGLGGITFAIITEIIDGVQGFGTVLVGIPKALGLGMIALIEVFFDGLGSVFGSASAQAARSFTDGVASLLGPLAQPAAVGTIMLSLATFFWFVNRLEITPWSFIQSVRS